MTRRWSTSLTGLVLVLSGLAVAAATAEAPAPDSRLQAARTTRSTLVVSADEVDYGTRVTLSGKLTAGGKGLKGRKVVLRQRPGGARTYAKVATVTTNRRGAWKKVVVVRLRGSWIATFKGNRDYAGSRSPKRQVDVFAPLTDYAVSPGNRDAYKDETWTFTARTAPELAGGTVSLLRGPSRAPTTVRTATIGPGGAIAVAHPMSEVGQQEFWLSVNSGPLMYGADSPHTVVRTRREGAPTAPSIATTSLPSVEEHVPYQANLVGGGGELTWSLAGGTLPPGLALAPDGTITGAATTVGSWSFTVQAANQVGAATRTLGFTSLPGTLTVTTGRLYDAAVGYDYPDVPYSLYGWQEMYCTPCSQGASWRVTSGTLPPGMEFDIDEFVDPPASYVFGRPTQAGVWQFTVTGVAGERSGSKVFTLRVVPSVQDLLFINHNFTYSIPDGTLGQPYSHQFVATNGSGATWSALSQLPPGLTLSPGGLLSGTPTVAGAGPVTVAVTDATRYDWQSFGFTVYAAP